MELNSNTFLVLFAVALAFSGFMLYRLIACTHDLEWQDLVATNGKLNAYKVGYWIGIGVGSWAVIKTTYMGDLDAIVFAAYLAFCGGVPVAAGAVGRLGARGETRRRDVDDPDKR